MGTCEGNEKGDRGGGGEWDFALFKNFTRDHKHNFCFFFSFPLQCINHMYK
jgi:hypothetical protein